MKNTNKGFTLIELLVVIAIIGILSSIVLASLNTARNKGSDVAVKGNLNGVRSSAALYYDNNSNSYGTIQAFSATACSATTGNGVFSDPNIRNAVAAAMSASGTSAVGVPCVSLGSPVSSWAIAAPLKTTGLFFCVDDQGSATTTASTNGGLSSTDATCG